MAGLFHQVHTGSVSQQVSRNARRSPDHATSSIRAENRRPSRGLYTSAPPGEPSSSTGHPTQGSGFPNRAVWQRSPTRRPGRSARARSLA